MIFDEPPPPDYPSIADGRSFNMDDLGDSDSEDDGFMSEAPPNYLDVTGPRGESTGWGIWYIIRGTSTWELVDKLMYFTTW